MLQDKRRVGTKRISQFGSHIVAARDELEAEDWSAEEIPDDDWLFMRVKYCYVERGEPTPAAFANVSPFLNWGVLFMLGAIVYYALMSRSMALGMIVISAAMVGVLMWANTLAVPLWKLSVAVFVVAWIGSIGPASV